MRLTADDNLIESQRPITLNGCTCSHKSRRDVAFLAHDAFVRRFVARASCINILQTSTMPMVTCNAEYIQSRQSSNMTHLTISHTMLWCSCKHSHSLTLRPCCGVAASTHSLNQQKNKVK